VGQAIGESITYAVGVAISPLPIIAVVLMLLSKKAGANSQALAFGWMLGITGTLILVILVSGTLGTGTDSAPSHGTSTTKLILGAGVLLLGFREWRSRPATGQSVPLPRWLQAIEAVTPVKSLGLGIVLTALNPKNLLLLIGGGLAIAGAPTSSAAKVGSAAVFVVLAMSTVVLPVVVYRVLGARVRPTLEALDAWLQANNATVMSVLLLVIGVVLIGKGIGGF
jgi:hypothetical protein